MSVSLMLGGIAIQPHAGAPEISEYPIGGESSLRLSGGALVSMRHWEKMAGSISATGLVPPALAGLDFSQPLELRSIKAHNLQSTSTSFVLPFAPRPDKAPWAFAVMPDRRFVPVSCTVTGRSGTVTALAGAAYYQLWFMPVYTVKCSRPSESQGSVHGWQLDWEEC